MNQSPIPSLGCPGFSCHGPVLPRCVTARALALALSLAEALASARPEGARLASNPRNPFPAAQGPAMIVHLSDGTADAQVDDQKWHWWMTALDQARRVPTRWPDPPATATDDPRA